MPVVIIHGSSDRGTALRVHLECKSRCLLFIDIYLSIESSYRKPFSRISCCLCMDYRPFSQIIDAHFCKNTGRDIHCLFSHYEPKAAFHGRVRYLNPIPFPVAHKVPDMFCRFFFSHEIDTDSFIGFAPLLQDPGKQGAV